MSQFYKITSVKPTGWDADDYGNVVDSVFLEGVKDSVLWRHAQNTALEVGKEFYGRIEPAKSGKGQWFKREQAPEGVDVPAEANQAPRSTGGDGAKQGMAINNAASYVVGQAVRDSITLDPQELADEIARYAKEIYKIDLTVTPTQSTEDKVMEIMNS